MAKDAKNNNKDIKNKKHFFKDFKAELKKVIWPTPKQIVNNTIAVITIVIIAAAIVFVLDLVFKIFNDKGINKIKENVRNKTEVENVIDDNTGDAEDSENDESSDTEVIEQDGIIVETTPVNSEQEQTTEEN